MPFSLNFQVFMYQNILNYGFSPVREKNILNNIKRTKNFPIQFHLASYGECTRFHSMEQVCHSYTQTHTRTRALRFDTFICHAFQNKTVCEETHAFRSSAIVFFQFNQLLVLIHSKNSVVLTQITSKCRSK